MIFSAGYANIVKEEYGSIKLFNYKLVNILFTELLRLDDCQKSIFSHELFLCSGIFPLLMLEARFILFQGKDFFYNPDDEVINIACMFEFVKVTEQNRVEVANRIFETLASEL